jgi:hypothetical protein
VPLCTQYLILLILKSCKSWFRQWHLEESNYKTGVETWHGACLPRTTPSDFVCHPSKIGEFNEVMCNNAFIHCITHNPLLPSRASGNGEARTLRHSKWPCGKRVEFVSLPLLPSRASGNGEARTLRHSKCPCGKRVEFVSLPLLPSRASGNGEARTLRHSK